MSLLCTVPALVLVAGDRTVNKAVISIGGMKHDVQWMEDIDQMITEVYTHKLR